MLERLRSKNGRYVRKERGRERERERERERIFKWDGSKEECGREEVEK